ncbi:MAG: hypothetical protein IJF05_04900 [Clostridia bacterium]|nr:hypothetical protein [Clostridia bacterium]
MSDTKKKSSYSALTGFRRAVPIILAAVAVFIGLCFVTQATGSHGSTGSLGRAISSVLLGLFSWGAYLIPALIGLHALFYASDVAAKRVVTRIMFSSVAVISVSAFAHAVRHWNNGELAFSIGSFYKDGINAVGGGAVGGTIGFGIIEIIGSIGVIILAATVVAVYITYFFSSGKSVIGRMLYGTLKGIVYFCAWVEKGIKRLFGANRKAEKKAKATEEKNRALMDDEFFDVDNGIEHLEISELGISETRDKASVEDRATLRDKVHHKSEVSPEEAVEAERIAREKAAASAAYYEDVTAKAEDKGFVIDDAAFIDKKPRTAEATSSTAEKEPSADDIFTADFDPYELAMSERLASKPSSRSLLDEKPSVKEEIFELTEEDAERARRNAEFERRKSAVIAESTQVTDTKESTEATARAEGSAEVYSSEAEKGAESGKSEYGGFAPVSEGAVKFSYPRDYGHGADKAASASGAPDVGYVSGAASTSAEAIGGASATAVPAYTEAANTSNTYEPSAREEARATENGARATYRRAAEFASATVAEGHEPSATEPRDYAPRAEERTGYGTGAGYTDRSASAGYTDRSASAGYTDRSASAGYTDRSAAYAAPTGAASTVDSRAAGTAYTEPTAAAEADGYKRTDSAYGESASVAQANTFGEYGGGDARDGADYAEPSAAYEETKSSEPKPEYNFSFADEDDGDVYTPSFENEESASHGEYSTDGEEGKDVSPSFKEYGGADAGGLVFEFDMGCTEERKTLVTETTHYGDYEEDAPDESVSEVEEVVEEEPSDEEIPPERRNPVVAEMRDMFPALREEQDNSDTENESDADESDTFGEDEPPFDEPIAVAPAAPKKEEKPEKPKAKPSYKNYKKPPIELMGLEEVHDTDEISQEIRENTNIIIETLASFNVVASIKGVDRGPRITRYEVVPAKGVKVNQITNLLDNITMNLAAEGIRMEAPIPGKSAIGFEIPNKNPTNVRLRELLECEEFINAKSNTFVCIGKDVAGNPVFGDIAKFPHALVAGATGMGKSVCINSIMISLLYKSRPDQIKFIMIDPKKVEFRMYSGIPHLLIPVITDAKQAAGALMWAVDEMERRYDLIEKLNIRNIEAYNERQAVDPSIGEHMPKIVIVIDELNDLMMQVRDPVEGLIMRIAQKARAAGIHLIIGTQRPDVKVITGTIKANINTRISCKVTSVVDSRTILEMAGAEKLLNRGDMLFKPVDKTKPIRVQGAFVSDNEVEAIMDFLKSQGEGAQYDEEIFAEVNKAAQKCGNKKGGGGDSDDDDGGEDAVGYYNDQKFLDAVELAIRSGKISTSLLQRKMSIGYGKAAKYIDAMEEIGVVSEANGQKPRDVLISMDQWYDKLSRVDLG